MTLVVITKQFGNFLLFPKLPDLPVDYRGILPRCWEWSSDSPWFVCVRCFLWEREIQVLNKCDEIRTSRHAEIELDEKRQIWATYQLKLRMVLELCSTFGCEKNANARKKTQGIREVWHAQHMLDIQKKENQSWKDYHSVALFVKPIQGRYIKGPRRLICCCYHLWVFGIHLSLPKSPILCIQMVVCFLMQDDCAKVMAIPANILPTSKVPGVFFPGIEALEVVFWWHFFKNIISKKGWTLQAF